MNNIEYLYHYTNIETLALIFKNHTIRFNSLDKVDDLQEQETADVKNFGQFFYISSWTDDATESIPMWNMYASLNLGVRIKLRKNPFKIYNNTADELSKVVNMPVIDDSNGKPFQTLIPLTEIFQKGFFSTQAMSKQLLLKVEYTNNTEKLYPKILKIDRDGFGFGFEIGNFGRHKNLHWKFQKEWRYIMNMIPLNLNQSQDKIRHDFDDIVVKIISGKEKQPFPYYDMRLSDEAFSDMEITLSPRISAGSRIIVQNLVEKYNPSATIIESNLLGLI
jgi:hypothetical protein